MVQIYVQISNEQVFVLEHIRIHSNIRQTLLWISFCMLCSISNPGSLFRLSYSLNNSFLAAPFQFQEETISKKQCKHYAQDVKHMGSDNKLKEISWTWLYHQSCVMADFENGLYGTSTWTMPNPIKRQKWGFSRTKRHREEIPCMTQQTDLGKANSF